VNYAFEFAIPGAREVFLRAQALHALGRYDEAAEWYTPRRGLGFLAPSHYYRGEMYQEMGDTEKALWHYGAFVELWRDADPEYQPVVEQVRERMARLTSELGAGG
jgi:tetratricopeptide (TPR) repeat protein